MQINHTVWCLFDLNVIVYSQYNEHNKKKTTISGSFANTLEADDKKMLGPVNGKFA